MLQNGEDRRPPSFNAVGTQPSQPSHPASGFGNRKAWNHHDLTSKASENNQPRQDILCSSFLPPLDNHHSSPPAAVLWLPNRPSRRPSYGRGPKPSSCPHLRHLQSESSVQKRCLPKTITTMRYRTSSRAISSPASWRARPSRCT